ncbi:unnamed protein product [Toxocara canis]|uniref:HNHc domain-containing protein n=1 Tax=Toxocara canis TaxID=6265 RepID=A0A183TW68_TOXCA|nr:unnamed protein product [Toxocara canis]
MHCGSWDPIKILKRYARRVLPIDQRNGENSSVILPSDACHNPEDIGDTQCIVTLFAKSNANGGTLWTIDDPFIRRYHNPDNFGGAVEMIEFLEAIHSVSISLVLGTQ